MTIITRNDLLDFWTGRCDDEMHAAINLELDNPESEVTAWFDMMMHKSHFPELFSWRSQEIWLNSEDIRINEFNLTVTYLLTHLAFWACWAFLFHTIHGAVWGTLLGAIGFLWDIRTARIRRFERTATFIEAICGGWVFAMPFFLAYRVFVWQLFPIVAIWVGFFGSLVGFFSGFDLKFILMSENWMRRIGIYTLAVVTAFPVSALLAGLSLVPYQVSHGTKGMTPLSEIMIHVGSFSLFMVLPMLMFQPFPICRQREAWLAISVGSIQAIAFAYCIRFILGPEHLWQYLLIGFATCAGLGCGVACTKGFDNWRGMQSRMVCYQYWAIILPSSARLWMDGIFGPKRDKWEPGNPIPIKEIARFASSFERATNCTFRRLSLSEY
ncbi:MAG: hypothetical protein KC653_00635 [Candidatus Andersenbacteria bacterium]|nr:hypothetical protein [Candidatus Andersenbacteria bacterium]